MPTVGAALLWCLQKLRPGLGQLRIHAPRPPLLPVLPQVAALPAGPPPRISIVVPSFNQGRFLSRTLDSILAQGYPNLELIVVDGASSDQSVELIRRYSHRLAWWISEPDQGQADAINKGFAQASGDLLAWINSDDLVAPGALHAIAAYFAAHPEIDAVYGDRIVIDPDDREVGRWMLPFHSPRTLRWVDYVPQETLYWRRRAWELVGSRVDANLQFALDWDLVLRFAAHGIKFAHLPRPLGLFRVHAQQKTSAQLSETGRREMRALRQRELGFSPGRARILVHVIPYLLAARLRELASVSLRRRGRPG